MEGEGRRFNAAHLVLKLAQGAKENAPLADLTKPLHYLLSEALRHLLSKKVVQALWVRFAPNSLDKFLPSLIIIRSLGDDYANTHTLRFQTNFINNFFHRGLAVEWNMQERVSPS